MPVVGKSAAEISTRAAYFQKMTDLQIRSPSMKGIEILCHPKISDLLAHTYFALNEAYKTEFLYPEKRTDPIKQAAITCATIATIRPLHAPAEAVDREEYIYMNQMFAMRCACGIIDHPFHKRAFDERRRFFMMLQRIDLPSAAPIIEESARNNGVISSNLKLKLSVAEEFSIKALVSMFAVLKDLKIFKDRPAEEE